MAGWHTNLDPDDENVFPLSKNSIGTEVNQIGIFALRGGFMPPEHQVSATIAAAQFLLK